MATPSMLEQDPEPIAAAREFLLCLQRKSGRQLVMCRPGRLQREDTKLDIREVRTGLRRKRQIRHRSLDSREFASER
jgi:hypothetical protein